MIIKNNKKKTTISKWPVLAEGEQIMLKGKHLTVIVNKLHIIRNVIDKIKMIFVCF